MSRVSPSPNNLAGGTFTNTTKTRTVASSIALSGNVIDYRSNRNLELLHDDMHSAVSEGDGVQQDAIATNVQNTVEESAEDQSQKDSFVIHRGLSEPGTEQQVGLS